MLNNEIILNLLNESINTKKEFTSSKNNIELIEKAAALIITCYKSGGKILVFGNGGSAADSQHLAAEMVVRFEKKRKALSAIALTVNSSSLTAIGNDFEYKHIFSRQIEAIALKNDVAIAISTSGNSENIILAVEKARELGLKIIALTGNDGGKLAAKSDIPIIVKSNSTARIQEVHITIIHILCKLIDNAF